MAFGDRRDGKKVRGLDGMHGLMPKVKPKRCESDVYINQKFDVTNLVKYVEKYNKNKEDKLTYFHTFCLALGKTVYNRPLLNRFIINGNYYDRNEVSLSFVAKTKFADQAEEYFSVIKVDEEDNIENIKDKISKKVNKIRSNDRNDTDDLVNTIGKLPKPLKAIAWWVIKFMDNHDLLPKSAISDNIYYSTMLVSNLGTFDSGAIYHSLTEFGTNSIVVTIGKIHKEYIVDENGKQELRDICEFGINLDERIADGFYFIKAVKILQHIFDNPELLEENANEKIEK